MIKFQGFPYGSFIKLVSQKGSLEQHLQNANLRDLFFAQIASALLTSSFHIHIQGKSLRLVDADIFLIISLTKVMVQLIKSCFY